MFHVYLVRINEDPVGIVAHTPEGYRFYAIGQLFDALENELFESVALARSAALALAAHA